MIKPFVERVFFGVRAILSQVLSLPTVMSIGVKVEAVIVSGVRELITPFES